MSLALNSLSNRDLNLNMNSNFETNATRRRPPATRVKPEPTIVYIWGLNGPDQLQKLSKKVGGFALRLFGGVWKPIAPVQTPNTNDFLLRLKSGLQLAKTLVSVAVA